MKITRNFDSAQIMANIKAGNTTRLYTVLVISHEINDDENGVTEEPYFAGTTEEEVRQTLDELEATLKPEKFEQIQLQSFYFDVTPDSIDYDPEYDEPEDVIINFLENANEPEKTELEDRFVDYNYRKIEGCIILTWSWERYVGYAMKLHSLDMETRPTVTEEICAQRDDLRPQCSIVLTREQVYACKSREELSECIAESLRNFKEGKWVRFSNIDARVDTFLDELYNSGRYAPYIPL